MSEFNEYLNKIKNLNEDHEENPEEMEEEREEEDYESNDQGINISLERDEDGTCCGMIRFKGMNINVGEEEFEKLAEEFICSLNKGKNNGSTGKESSFR